MIGSTVSVYLYNALTCYIKRALTEIIELMIKMETVQTIQDHNILDDYPEAIVILDQYLNCTYFNARASAINAQIILGNGIHAFLPDQITMGIHQRMGILGFGESTQLEVLENEKITCYKLTKISNAQYILNIYGNREVQTRTLNQSKFFIGALMHLLNNSLTIVLGRLARLESELDENQRAILEVRKIRQRLVSISKILKYTWNLSPKGLKFKKYTDNNIIANLEDLDE